MRSYQRRLLAAKGLLSYRNTYCKVSDDKRVGFGDEADDRGL